MRRQTDDKALEVGLEAWGRSIVLPAAPVHLKTAVSRRVAAEGRQPPSRGWWEGRIAVGTAGLGIATAVTIAAVLALSQPGSSVPTPRAAAIMTRAALTSPAQNILLRQTFRVQDESGKTKTITTLNVWEAVDNDAYTVLEVRPRPSISASRFVERTGWVQRDWTANASGAKGLLTALNGTPASVLDGRMIAAGLMSAEKVGWSKAFVGEERIAGHKVYVIRLINGARPKAGITLALDSRTYRLVAVNAGSFRARLVRMSVFSRSTTPNLVFSYLKSKQKPAPQTATEAY